MSRDSVSNALVMLGILSISGLACAVIGSPGRLDQSRRFALVFMSGAHER
jgi:hypothetical protein